MSSLKRAPRWERRKEARPQEITRAALAVFVEKGFAATKAEEIAIRAGVSKGTLYLYFESKEELFKAVVREGIVPALVEGEDSLARHDGATADLLCKIVFRWWELVGAQPIGGIPKLVIAEANNFPDLARFYYDEVIVRGTQLLRDVLTRGIEAGEFRSVDLNCVVHIAIAPMIMKVLWDHSFCLCGIEDLPSQAYLQAYLDLLIHGLLRDSSGAAL